MLKFFCRPKGDYPNIPPEIDLRARLPFRRLKEMKVCNVGAGSGYSGNARQLPFLHFKELDFIDVDQEYLDAAKARRYMSDKVNFIKRDVRNHIFNKYDLVMMFDVLEHLPKNDSLAVMAKIQCAQLIFIPLEKEYRANVYGHASQDHLSFWTKEDFDNLGYQTEELYNFHNEDGRTFSALWAWKE
jgi:hypothetical protein